MKINNNITFGARTNIFCADNILSQKEIKKLTKVGEKIGTDADSIDMYVGKVNEGRYMFTHSANFKSIDNPINTSSVQFPSLSEIAPYDFVQKKLNSLKAFYKKVK